jgi:hypothetical protein
VLKLLLLVQIVFDFLNLSGDERGVGVNGRRVELGENGGCFFLTTICDEPSGEAYQL